MILVLADDMTGALEVGAAFAAAGFRTIVSTRVETGPEVLVVDTETRHLTPAAAFERVVQIAREAGIPDLVYKKTDSTLRGNIRAELNALSASFPEWAIGYAPAYPQQGRTVVGGIVYVHGVPVAETSFARDGLNPVLSSSVRDLIGPELPCTVFDGSTDLEVKHAAEAILSDPAMRIAAGPTALAAALARQLRALPRVSSCVVMNGSRTEVSESQVRHAESHRCLSRSEACAWVLADPAIAAEGGAAEVASMRAEHVIDFLRRRPSDAVLIIGGDTAYAFVCALGNPPITPIGEVVPGVPISRIADRDLLLITKAGGFGGVDVLCQIRRTLEQNAQ